MYNPSKFEKEKWKDFFSFLNDFYPEFLIKEQEKEGNFKKFIDFNFPPVIFSISQDVFQANIVDN